MGILKSFLEENKKLAAIIFLVWLCFCLAGAVFGSKLDQREFADAERLIEETFQNPPAIRGILKRGALSDLKLLGLVIIASLGAFMSPVIFFIVAFRGFSSGFCASALMRVFPAKGIAVNFVSVVLPCALSLPVYIAVFVSALKFALSPRKDVLTSRVSQRRKQWLSYFLLQLCLTLCLFSVTVIEAFLTRGLIFIMNK